MSIPLPFGVILEDADPEKLKTTIKFILNKCLEDHHRTDPTVLKFIEAYLLYYSVNMASKVAGITRNEGNNLKNRPDIFKAITQIADVSAEKFGYNAAEVVERVKEVLNFDPAVVENDDGSYKTRMSDIPFESRGAIKKFKVRNIFGIDENGIRTVTGEIIEIEVWDKMKAADMLGPEKGVFKQVIDVNTNVKISITGALEEAEKRMITARDVTPNE